MTVATERPTLEEIAERQLAELAQIRVLLTAVLSLAQAVVPEVGGDQAGPVGCPHPETAHQDFSTMGERWIRCGQCGADVVRTTKGEREP